MRNQKSESCEQIHMRLNIRPSDCEYFATLPGQFFAIWDPLRGKMGGMPYLCMFQTLRWQKMNDNKYMINLLESIVLQSRKITCLKIYHKSLLIQ